MDVKQSACPIGEAVERLKAALNDQKRDRDKARDGEIAAAKETYDHTVTAILEKYRVLEMGDQKVLLGLIPPNASEEKAVVAVAPVKAPDQNTQTDLRQVVLAWINSKPIGVSFKIPDIFEHLRARNFKCVPQSVYSLMDLKRGLKGVEKAGRAEGRYLYRRTAEAMLGGKAKKRRRRKGKMRSKVVATVPVSVLEADLAKK